MEGQGTISSVRLLINHKDDSGSIVSYIFDFTNTQWYYEVTITHGSIKETKFRSIPVRNVPDLVLLTAQQVPMYTRMAI